MKRSTLSPEQAAWLNATFDRNRSAYGGARMMADGDEADKVGGDADDSTDKAKGDDKSADKGASDGALGEGGKKALDAERDARKAAEDQVKSLRGEFDGFKSALTEALGIKPKDGDDGTNALTAVQEQLAAMQRESSVLKLANEHQITDKEDLELLATAKDADSMAKLAERLAPKEQERDATSRKPKSDRSQGGATTASDNGTVAAGRDLFEARRGAKKSTAS